ncbi:MAG: hypothetical protein ABI895_21535 [Deltaproteobacteria bacterium]
MKKFVVTFIGSASALERAEWKKDALKQRALEEAGMEAWGKWVKDNEKSIADPGSALGKTKRVSADGISDTRNNIAAYVIVQAESHEAAAKMFESHPHFAIFPGDCVEVMECLPLPQR